MRPNESFVGQPVRSLQQMLRHIAEADDRQTSVVPDGIYGRNTQKAVESFQRNNGLPVTGVADPATWDRIVQVYTPIQIEKAPAEPLQIIINPGKVFRRGDTGYYIYLIQVILLALGQVHGSMTPPDITGILDEQTAQAILTFQYLNGLPQTGDVDKQTWKNMALQYPLAVNHVSSENITRR